MEDLHWFLQKIHNDYEKLDLSSVPEPHQRQLRRVIRGADTLASVIEIETKRAHKLTLVQS